MSIKYTDYCSKCKLKGIPLTKINTNKLKTIQYHYCRDCQNKKTRTYYKKNPKKCRKIIKKSIDKYKQKQRIRNQTRYWIVKGVLQKPETCSFCFEKVERICAHHPDYRKPLEVVWLCGSCHANEHRH